MAYNAQYGEGGGEVDIWSNSIPYLQRISILEDRLQHHYLLEDVPSCLKIIDALMIQLKRNTKKEKKLRNDWMKLERLYGEAEDLVYESRRINGRGRVEQNNRRMLLRDAFLKVRECWIIIGDLQYELGLIFRKGIDPNEAWALG